MNILNKSKNKKEKKELNRNRVCGTKSAKMCLLVTESDPKLLSQIQTGSSPGIIKPQ